MGPYSHFVMAHRVITLVRPQDESEYYWGSIIPDIRYLAEMRRAQTHIDEQRIREFALCYPHLKSFLQGYRVHCLIDEIDLQAVVGKAFPLNIINWMFKGKISQPQIAMLVELYYLQAAHSGQLISGSQNEVLAELGIKPAHVDIFLLAMQEYFQSPCFETVFSAFQRIGMVKNPRAEKYINAARQLQRNPLLLNLLMTAVKNSNLDRLAIAHISSSFEESSLF
jgi:hypothetical protein